MVFTSLQLFRKPKGPDEFWRKRKVFKLAAHYYGRSRNCYSLSIRAVLRALAFATKGRVLRKKDMRDLCLTRTAAGCEELGVPYPIFKEGLNRSQVFLNNKVLADLAMWEPRSFKALTQFAWVRMEKDGVPEVENLGKPPTNVTKVQNLKT